MNKKNRFMEKKKKKGSKLLLGLGILLCSLAFIQVSLLIYVWTLEPSHNSIVGINGQIITTEVCTDWFNLNESNKKIYETNPSYSFKYNGQFIPQHIVIEVCDKWKIVKEEVDKNG